MALPECPNLTDTVRTYKAGSDLFWLWAYFGCGSILAAGLFWLWVYFGCGSILAVGLDLDVDLSPQGNDIDPQRIRPKQSSPQCELQEICLGDCLWFAVQG